MSRAMGPGRLWKRGSSWVLDYRQADARRKRKVLGTDKRVAERRRMQIIAQRDMQLDGLGAVQGMELQLAEVVEEYLADLKLRSCSRHFSTVASRLRRAVQELGSPRVRDLKPMQVVRVRSAATARGLSNRSANLIVQSIQAALKWAVENGVIADSPIALVKPLPYSREHHRYQRRSLTDAEIEAFLAAAREDDAETEQQMLLTGARRVPQVFLWLGFLQIGARYGEMRQVTWNDVDLRKRVVTLRAETTKSKKQRVVPLRGDFVEQLRNLRVIQQRALGRLPTVSDFVFLTPSAKPWGRPSNNLMRILNRVLTRARIPKIDQQGQKLDIHALRTTAGSLLARNGVPLVQVQKILGHSSPALTAAVYTHLEADDLRPAVEGIPNLENSSRDDKKAN